MSSLRQGSCAGRMFGADLRSRCRSDDSRSWLIACHPCRHRRSRLEARPGGNGAIDAPGRSACEGGDHAVLPVLGRRARPGPPPSPAERIGCRRAVGDADQSVSAAGVRVASRSRGDDVLRLCGLTAGRWDEEPKAAFAVARIAIFFWALGWDWAIRSTATHVSLTNFLAAATAAWTDADAMDAHDGLTIILRDGRERGSVAFGSSLLGAFTGHTAHAIDGQALGRERAGVGAAACALPVAVTTSMAALSSATGTVRCMGDLSSLGREVLLEGWEMGAPGLRGVRGRTGRHGGAFRGAARKCPGAR